MENLPPTALVSPTVADLAPYPMEELARIRQALREKGVPVFDFGTGDPKIPTWAPIRDALQRAIPVISQYPSVRGNNELKAAQLGYLQRRFGIKSSADLDIIPSQGSKEAVFNIALCLMGRAGGKKYLIYPDPGYPVYRSSALFAGGVPYPVRVEKEHGYLLEPWKLPAHVQQQSAAIWINHPHNPTGAGASDDYLQEVVAWSHKTNTILLADDCYVDIYDPSLDAKISSAAPPAQDPRPLTALQFSTDRVLTFMSLSKRSGLTGYRSGFIAGDSRLIQYLCKARANFGVGSPEFLQSAAACAWNDDAHVTERRKIFAKRMDVAFPALQKLGLVDERPQAAFYLWCRVPEKFREDDVRFVHELAALGVITSPSQWLSEGIKGYFRLALVPEEKDTAQAMDIIARLAK